MNSHLPAADLGDQSGVCAATVSSGRQHVIDPEICSACMSCLPICPERAIVERQRVLAIDPDRCRGCHACLDECTTGAIDSWIDLATAIPFSVEQQLEWTRLP